MEITHKSAGKTTMILEIKMVESDYKKSVNDSLINYQKKMNLPGFRVGKVPMTIVKKKYELPIKIDEINKLLSDSIQNYISKNKILILGGPMPLEKSIDFANSIDYIFEYELGLQPKINLSKGENQKIDYWVIDSKNKQITEHINSLTQRFGQVINPDVIKKGDMLNVNFKQLENGVPMEDGINHATSLLVDKIDDDKIQKQFLKLKKSDTIVFKPHKAFSNKTDLASMLNVTKEKLPFIQSDFICEVQNISRLLPAELNKDFFKKVYPEIEIKTEKEFKVQIKKELNETYIKESDRKLFNDASQFYIDKIKVDLPEEFLKRWLKNNAKKKFENDEFEKEYNNYLKYLSWQLIENKICQENNIKITNEDLAKFAKNRVLNQMKSYGNVNLGDKEIEGIVSNILQNKQESEKMTNEIVVIQLSEYFKSKMKIKRNTVSLDEFIKLANNQK